MKTKLFLLCLIVGFKMMGQTIDCYSTPDGIDASGWSYKDYVIPTGYQLDSVYMDATRPGYSTQDFDFVLESCQGTTVYTTGIGTYPFDYSTDNNSEYNIWIDLTSFNYVSIGMVRASLPTNAGAIWDSVCFSVSPYSATSIIDIKLDKELFVYPNPATDYIFIENVQTEISIYNSIGQIVLNGIPCNGKVDISALEKGVYFLRIEGNKNKMIIKK